LTKERIGLEDDPHVALAAQAKKWSFSPGQPIPQG
jgi:hypothetical protein